MGFARAHKSDELDSDLTNNVSYGRGKTATTYYSQEQTNGATPFSKVKSPVYIVGDEAEFHHDSGFAIYTGNARAWQDDNFVRADKLTIYVKEKKMKATATCRARSTMRAVAWKAATSTVPVLRPRIRCPIPIRIARFITKATLIFDKARIESQRSCRRLSFEGSSEVEKTIAQRNVVLTQPNRKANRRLDSIYDC